MDPEAAFEWSSDAVRDVVRSPDVIASVAQAAEVDETWLESVLAVSLAEAEHALSWLAPWVRRDARVLEVGAGLGLTSAILGASGVDVCSLEPGGPGFERYERVNPVLRTSLEATHQHFAMSVEDVTVEHTGTFDLIFSNNVLEHVRDVSVALGALGNLLRPDGVMVHNCPNYHVPYEPHFGIPLVPARPASTARLLPRSITTTGLWRSLNFVTARQVRSIADRHGATVQFQRGVLADAVARLTEAEFASRHRQLARLGTVFARLDPVLRRLPPAAVTPMIVAWHPPRSPAGQVAP